ncbi:MAG: spore protease YyaC [Peptococcaceae bacterium]|nr:spore protease YyaC [Peptococcaceae bacterium]
MKPLSIFSENNHIRAHYKDKLGISYLQTSLKNCLLQAQNRQVILLCIGTDRSTGDSLGPLTGTKIKEKCFPGLKVVGTLEQPVHAENLQVTLDRINFIYENPYIIALDACLGNIDSVGFITLTQGPLKPGTAVGKELPEVGEIHLTGVVNVNGFAQYLILQNTRLYTVWQMSDVICHIFSKIYCSKFNN